MDAQKSEIRAAMLLGFGAIWIGGAIITGTDGEPFIIEMISYLAMIATIIAYLLKGFWSEKIEYTYDPKGEHEDHYDPHEDDSVVVLD